MRMSFCLAKNGDMLNELFFGHPLVEDFDGSMLLAKRGFARHVEETFKVLVTYTIA